MKEKDFLRVLLNVSYAIHNIEHPANRRGKENKKIDCISCVLITVLFFIIKLKCFPIFRVVLSHDITDIVHCFFFCDGGIGASPSWTRQGLSDDPVGMLK